jgi:SAM-dependent methyltransferase
MNDILVFDRKAARHHRNRAAAHIKNSDFLFKWCRKEINERLSTIRRDFTSILTIGARERKSHQKGITIDIADSFSPDIIADEDLLPFAPDSFDMVQSNLSLHSVNDLPGALIQIRNVLKPDGLFIGTLLGGETLFELRQSLQEAEMSLTGGIKNRISPVADLKQMGALMQRAGFSLPVIDSEKIIVTYDSLYKLMRDLRHMGESNALINREKHFSSKKLFDMAEKIYKKRFSDTDGKIEATFEVIFLLGWAPHQSQQKPLRPGSAQKRMADALQTSEEKLPC